jgi:hypothetical protein
VILWLLLAVLIVNTLIHIAALRQNVVGKAADTTTLITAIAHLRALEPPKK